MNAFGPGLGEPTSIFWLIFDIALVLYWIGVFVLVISQDREPTATLAWLLVLFAVPYVGLVFYFLFGRDWPNIARKSEAAKRGKELLDGFIQQVYAPYRTQSEAFEATLGSSNVGRIVSLVDKKVDTPSLPVRTCDIFGDGQEYFDTLIEDLAGAQRFIHMSYFIWRHDELTARITTVLMDRLAAGVEVRILNDHLGELAYSNGELDALRAAGAFVSFDVARLVRINYRNHRKITVVDAEIGHSGGFNIGQEYIDGGKQFSAWRDTGIRITGPGVADLEKLFGMRWYEVFGEDLFDAQYYPDPSLPHGKIMVQTVHQGYEDPWNSATRSYQMAIAGARERVMIQSPYFVPDPTTLDTMINMAAGGVRVDFMTTAWPDKKVPYWAAESYFEQFLAAGGRIWLWEPGFFHAKTLTIDGDFCSIGTMNLDMRSLRINKELTIWVYDCEVAARSEQLFLDDLKDCRELTYEEVLAWSRFRRLRNSVMRLGSHLL